MIDVTVFLEKERWTLHLHCAVSTYHADTILSELRSLRCPENYLDEAEELLRSGRLDTGMTFSNRAFRESVVVVALTSSAAEFQNSLQHELRHLVDDITIADGIYEKEAVAYLTGEVNHDIFPYICELLCDNCRVKRLDNGA